MRFVSFTENCRQFELNRRIRFCENRDIIKISLANCDFNVSTKLNKYANNRYYQLNKNHFILIESKSIVQKIKAHVNLIVYNLIESTLYKNKHLFHSSGANFKTYT